MVPPGDVQLLVAHPGHELLLHGWIGLVKPVVHVVTDGSGHTGEGRLEMTAEFVRACGARAGAIFGALSDRAAYQMILACNTTLLLWLVTKLAAAIAYRPDLIVVDAVEGYNPVHDLCRMIAGAAIEMAGVDTKLYEYAVVDRPDAFDSNSGDVIAIDLDDAEHARKIGRARRAAGRVPDIDELLARHGAAAYRSERLRRVVDWWRIDDGGALPLYERLGEQRVAAKRYHSVIRRDDHMIPLRDSLRRAVEERSCAF
ncbi:MAG TPA: hypothetical protein VL284_05130 [Thermoanaerobaculia bacterium]|nr:hypothetical protein [Thermoanaerobaculia bacterium]